MDFDMILLPLRIAQFVIGFIVFGMACYTVNEVNKLDDFFLFWDPDAGSINFMLFNGLWTFLLAVPYLALCPRFFPVAAHKFAVLAVDAVTMLFWFAGFIALAALLGDDLEHCPDGSFCGTLKAETVFGAFEWVLFAVSTGLGVFGLVRGGVSSKTPAPMEVQAGV